MKNKENSKECHKTNVSASFAHDNALLNPALRLATLHGVLDSVYLHIDRQDNLNARDNSGHTPLMIAARKNHAKICLALLEAGADPNLLDNNGFSALDLAVLAKAEECQSILKSALSRTCSAPVTEVEAYIEIASVVPISSTFTNDEFFIDEWIALDETPPPADDLELRNHIGRIQASISVHVPVDTEVTFWDDVFAYLPEALRLDRLSGALVDGLRPLLLRSLREGSIPSDLLETLIEQEGLISSESIERLTSQVIQDLGAELDERFEFFGLIEDFRVEAPENATDEDAFAVDEALEYLDILLYPNNDPDRLFRKKAYNLSQLNQEQEVSLAKEMEESLNDALNALSQWPDGLQLLLSKCDEVKSGHLTLKSIQQRRDVDGSPTDPSYSSDIESHHQKINNYETEDVLVDDEDLNNREPQVETGLDVFLLQVAALRSLVASCHPTGHSIFELLQKMSLSGLFLSSLCFDNTKKGPSKNFNQCIKRYKEARDFFITSNLKLVVPLVRKYLGTGAEFSDLLQEAHIGLIRAVDKFDWRRGFKFSTMAVWWIRQQISRAAPELARLIRLPTHAVEKAWRLRQLIQKYHDENDATPTIKWLTKNLNLSEQKIESYLMGINDSLPLDILESEELIHGFEVVNPLDAASRMEIARNTESLLQKLGANRDWKMAEQILRMKYGVGIEQDFTLEEIVIRFGITKEQIRQIEGKALRRLKRDYISLFDSEKSSNLASEATILNINSENIISNEVKLQKISNLPRQPDINKDVQQKYSNSNEITELQKELLNEVKSLCIPIMIFFEAKKQKIIVMLTQINTEKERQIAIKLQAAGFKFSPGNGYCI